MNIEFLERRVSMNGKINLNEDETLNAKIENRKVVNEKNIKDLFEDFDGEYESIDIDWGEPVGKEIC